MTQKEALDILKTGRNVFLTGAAGSGKTFVLREYIKYLEEIGADFGVTASTGIAATHMGGITIHSWAGIGVREFLSKSDLEEIAERQKIKDRLSKVSVLIIDEISMLHHYRLDLVDAVLKKVKNSSLPFGGVQAVFCGDFFQLPPVRRAGEREGLFAYHSQTWKDLGLKVCYLSEQHRQNDQKYLEVLNAIRASGTNENTTKILEACFSKKSEHSPTRLYSHNKDVDDENEMELAKVRGKIFEYKMQSRGSKFLVEALKKSCLAPENLRLKEGAKVMFVKNNFDNGYVNGTLGIVQKCTEDEIEVKTLNGKTIQVGMESWLVEEDGKMKAEICQYPLRLAWAITVHKSQGMSLDMAEVDLSKSFERGMGYVALSRVRSLAGLFLKGLNDIALLVNEEALEFDKKFKKLSETSSFHIRTMGKEKILEMHDEFKKRVGSTKKDKKKKKPKIDTLEVTKQMLEEGLSVKEIAKERGLKVGTILDHVEEIREADPKFNIYNLRNGIPKSKFWPIYGAFKKIGLSEDGKYKLSPVRELLKNKFSYDDLRLVRLFL